MRLSYVRRKIEGRLQIAYIVPLILQIPPQGYGGIERLVPDLARRQRQLGHKTTIIQLPGISRPEFGDPDADEWQTCMVSRAIASSRDVLDHTDLVHNHCVHAQAAVHGLAAPSISTVHGDPLGRPGKATYSVFPEHKYVALSESQRTRGVPGQNWIATIPAGVDLDLYTLGTQRREEFFVHIASFGTRKGTLTAIETAKAASKPIVLIGRSAPDEPNYLENTLHPLIDGVSVIYAGDLGDHDKIAYLQRASALLHPIDWPEPFGLVYLEALACGTPVLTLDHGAASELIIDGVAGVVAKDVDQLTDAARHLPKFDRLECRESIAHLSAHGMALKYAELYEEHR